MRISDWSSDVCSSDLEAAALAVVPMLDVPAARVVAVEHVVAPVGGDGGAGIGALFRGVAAVGELADVARAAVRAGRSEERRGGKECVSTFRSRGSPYH